MIDDLPDYLVRGHDDAVDEIIQSVWATARRLELDSGDVLFVE